MLESPPTKRRPAPATAREHAELKSTWAALLGVGWPLALVVAAAIEPAPADPNAVPSALETLISAVLFGALVLTAVAAASRLRVAAVSGVGLGGIALGAALTCPLSGHHGIGLWFVAEFALFTTMLLASIAALGTRARAT